MNYALFLTDYERFGVCPTNRGPGIADLWDEEKQVSFTVLIAPKEAIDLALLIPEPRTGRGYEHLRNMIPDQKKKEAILSWFQPSTRLK